MPVTRRDEEKHDVHFKVGRKDDTNEGYCSRNDTAVTRIYMCTSAHSPRNGTTHIRSLSDFNAAYYTAVYG